MASNSSINVEITLNETKTDTSPADSDPKSLALSLEQNDSRITDSEGAQSPASSTYADCEETVSPSSEHSQDVNKAILKTDAIKVTSELQNDKVDEGDYEEVMDQKPMVEDNNSSTDKTNSNEKIEVGKNADENYVTDEIVNGDYENELDQHDAYDDEDCRKSLCQNETGSSESSDFESDEHENDRENGDGQEVSEENVIAQKKLDDDEDRRNPQYIPKKGFFYEHDNRTVGTSTDDETEDNKRKAESDEPERKARGRRSIPDGKWQHDLYKDDEQRPKSTQELIDIYGYDIRNEESAPKARRRRKYGRGPNKYTRQWENEEAYAKQVSTKGSRGQRQKLPEHREEYEAQFPGLKEQRKGPRARSRDRRETTPKRASFRESSKSNIEIKSKDEQRNYEAQPKDHDTVPAPTSLERSRSFTQRVPTIRGRSGDRNRSRSRSFTQRIPAVTDRSEDRNRSRSRSFSRQISTKTDRSDSKYEPSEKPDIRKMQKPLRKSIVATNIVRSRGRGAPVGRNPRYSNSNNNSGNNNFYDGESRSYESRVQFASANRGRGQQFLRPAQSNHRQNTSDDDLQELSYKMSNVDLKSMKRTIINSNVYANDSNLLKTTEPTQLQTLPAQGTTTIRSKRYSHQRQRLLPESSNQNTSVNINNAVATQSLQTMTHNMPSIMSSSNPQSVDASPQLQQQQQPQHQQQHQHPSISYLPQEAQMRRTAPPTAQANETTLTAAAVNASALPPSSLAVSASLIPLSAPPLTASGTALSSGAPPLPIVGFFQHPQDSVLRYPNQAAPAQLYSGDQTVIGGPSNQPVQLVAFLPASPMMQSTNHAQTAPPPPPPPPPPAFAGQVMSYPQASQTQQQQPSFTSETYSLPPVTLAPMPQTPEMYQSRGGVTYYNTRSQYKPRSPPPPRVKIAIPIVPPPSNEIAK